MGWPVAGIGAQRCPVALSLVVLIRNGALDDKNEGLQVAFGCQVESQQELLAVFDGKKGIVEIDLGNPRHATQNNVFDAWLRRRRHRNGVAIATKPCCDPQNIDLRDG